jgi:hypothetical protein
MLNSRAIAVDGVSYGPLLLAVDGFLSPRKLGGSGGRGRTAPKAVHESLFFEAAPITDSVAQTQLLSDARELIARTVASLKSTPTTTTAQSVFNDVTAPGSSSVNNAALISALRQALASGDAGSSNIGAADGITSLALDNRRRMAILLAIWMLT